MKRGQVTFVTVIVLLVAVVGAVVVFSHPATSGQVSLQSLATPDQMNEYKFCVKACNVIFNECLESAKGEQNVCDQTPANCVARYNMAVSRCRWQTYSSCLSNCPDADNRQN